jgi:hypothetical protein
MKTRAPPTRASSVTIAIATSIAINAGPEMSCRLDRVGWGVISSRSLSGMSQS